jgi:hypothetical protein
VTWAPAATVGRGFRHVSAPPPPEITEREKKRNMPNISNTNKMYLEQLSFYPEYSRVIRKIILHGLNASL